MTAKPKPELTWTCHVCGEKRPDGKISVHKIGIIGANVRYCNDREACEQGASIAGETWLSPTATLERP